MKIKGNVCVTCAAEKTSFPYYSTNESLVICILTYIHIYYTILYYTILISTKVLYSTRYTLTKYYKNWWKGDRYVIR